MNQRAMMLGGAIAVGAVAAVAAVLGVRHAQATTTATSTADAAVFVAAQDIPSGTTGTNVIARGLARVTRLPRTAVPATAVTDLAVIKSEVTTSPIAAGQIIVSGGFAAPNAATASASGVSLPPGEVAITVSLDPAHAVAGLIVPGDNVNLMTIFTPKSPAADGSTSYAHFFYQNVPVLAIGTTQAATADGKAAANPGSNLYTFAVTPEAAERLVLAAANTTLYAALVPPNNKAVVIPAVGSGQLDQAQPSNAQAPSQNGATK